MMYCERLTKEIKYLSIEQWNLDKPSQPQNDKKPQNPFDHVRCLYCAFHYSSTIILTSQQ